MGGATQVLGGRLLSWGIIPGINHCTPLVFCVAHCYSLYSGFPTVGGIIVDRLKPTYFLESRFGVNWGMELWHQPLYYSFVGALQKNRCYCVVPLLLHVWGVLYLFLANLFRCTTCWTCQGYCTSFWQTWFAVPVSLDVWGLLYLFWAKLFLTDGAGSTTTATEAVCTRYRWSTFIWMVPGIDGVLQ